MSVTLQVVDTTAVVERLLRNIVVVALGDALERLNGLRQRHGRAGHARELLGHVHVLRQELLDAACTRDGDLVVLAQLVDAEDRDNVLQLLVLLQNGLDVRGDVVVLAAHEGSRIREVEASGSTAG